MISVSSFREKDLRIFIEEDFLKIDQKLHKIIP